MTNSNPRPKPSVPEVTLPRLSRVEFNHVLAGLQSLQRAVVRNAVPDDIALVATEGGMCRSLSHSELDELAERINCETE